MNRFFNDKSLVKYLRPFIKLLQLSFKFILIVFLLTLTLFLSLYFVVFNLPSPNQFEIVRQSFHIVVKIESDLKVLAYRYKIPIKLSEIPQHLQEVFTTIEEDNFFNLRDSITQKTVNQLFFLKPASTWQEKLKELLLCIMLEIYYGNQEIQAIYFNHADFGNNAYGIEMAARQYFGKRPQSLNIYESALLAATVQTPTEITLLTHPEQIHNQAKLILEQMLEQKYMTQAQFEDILQVDIQKGNRKLFSVDYGYFYDWIKPQIKKYLQNKSGTFRILTTLDTKLQLIAELAIQRTLDKYQQRDLSQAALVTMTPTGSIKAMVGGKSYPENPLNRVTQVQREVASTFKPIVYLTALEQGVKPEDKILDDIPIENPYRQSWPRNYQGKYHGMVTIQDALAHSYNAASVRLLKQVKIENAIAVARKLGFTAPLPNELRLVLGLGENTLFEMTTIYATFAHHGQKVFPYGIAGIINEAGQMQYHHSEPKHRQLIKKTDVEHLNQMLIAAVEGGTGELASFANHQVAGKTGTSQDYRDAWFIGYSRYLVTGVWAGNDDKTATKQVTGGEVPTLIWKTVMENAHLNLPPKPLL